ncbi:MAG: putative photosynthetic complex assembly protein PuhE [Pseudomonadota bacterium]
MTLAVLSALFIWWFSTGAILLVINRGSGRTAVWATAPLAVLAAWGMIEGGGMTDVGGAYLGFAAAITVWGWFELAFLTGVLTGPNREPCPLGARGMKRFRLAWRTIAHHELAILLTAVVLVTFLWNAENLTGLLTFLILFVARISAKVNIYLGVPNFTDEMLPQPVEYLRTYFASRWMNLLFPFSITALTAAVTYWVEHALIAPAGSGAEVGFALLATLTSLALLEHWLMVLPVRDSLLWRWMTSKPGASVPNNTGQIRVSGGTHGL